MRNNCNPILLVTKTDELRGDISEQIRRTVDRRQNNIATNIAKSEIVWNEEINVKTRTATENIYHHRMCNRILPMHRNICYTFRFDRQNYMQMSMP